MSRVSRFTPLTVALTAAALVFAGAAAATDVSSNWSGYAVSGTNAATGQPTQFTSVSGSWVQPKASCSARGASYSAFWVGLGGYSLDSQALEQIGTSSDCPAGGAARYSVWYELVPDAAVTVKLKVFPGNRVSAAVNVSGNTVVVRLDNLTRHTFFQKKLMMGAPDLTSAEWVAEAPSSCDSRGRCSVLPLANFGSVAFTQASTTGDGHPGTIADTAWAATPIWLITDSRVSLFTASMGGSGAVPGTLSTDGTTFSIGWQQSVTPPEPAPSPTPDTPSTP
jgi:hypothetical protein